MSGEIQRRQFPDLAKSTPADFENFAKTDPAGAGELITALLRRNTDMLPGTSFVRREGGFLKKIMGAVKLSESQGTLVRLGSKRSGDDYIPVYDVSLTGYRRINELVGLQIIRPSTVVVDGRSQMNPYIHVDPETQNPRVVYARCLAVGLTNIGSLVATDAMVRLDVNIYLMENIQAKMKAAKDQVARDAIARIGIREDKPDAEGGWVFFPMHGPIGLWVNYRSRVIQNVLSDHTTRLKFMERLGQAFAERNAIKAHPAIPNVVDAHNGVARVTAIGWTTDLTRSDIDRMRELAEEDRLDTFKSQSGRGVEVREHHEAELDEGAMADLEHEAVSAQGLEKGVQEESGDGDQPEEEVVATKRDEEDEDLLSLASAAFAKLKDYEGLAGAKNRLRSCGIDNLEEAKPDDLRRFLDIVREVEAG